MMPGIIISSIFSEQSRLAFRATPLQNQFAGAEEAVNDTSNWLCIQISAPNFPGSTGSCLFALEQTSLRQPFDRTVADTTYARSFA